MGQIYPTPSSFGQSLTINTIAPLTGGGPVSSGGSLTLGLSTSNSSTRQAYVVTPAPDGTTANFTIVGFSSGSNVSYANVFVDGKLQFTSTFTLSGSTLSLNTPPTTGQKVRVVCSTPSDNRQQVTLTSSSSTVFTFPSVSPQSTYVDVYDGNGKLQTVGTTGYYLDITNGVYSVVFASAPATPVVTVFDPTVNSGRNLYTTTAITSTIFSISSGSPSTSYIDVFDQGLFLMEGSSYDYTLSYTSGSWVITFVTAPVAPVAIFAPTTVVPPSQSIGSVVNTLNGLSGNVTLAAGSNVTLTPSGNNITIAASGTITGVTAGTGLSGGGTGGSVTLDLAPTSVSPGSYTNTNLTVNAEGQITAASNGSGGGGGFTSGSNANGYWVKDPTGHIHQWGNITTDINGGPTVVTFPTTFTTTLSVSVLVSTVSGTDLITYVNNGTVDTIGFSVSNNGSGGFASWTADGF